MLLADCWVRCRMDDGLSIEIDEEYVRNLLNKASYTRQLLSPAHELLELFAVGNLATNPTLSKGLEERAPSAIARIDGPVTSRETVAKREGGGVKACEVERRAGVPHVAQLRCAVIHPREALKVAVLLLVELPVVFGIVVKGLILKSEDFESLLIDVEKVGWDIVLDCLRKRYSND